MHIDASERRAQPEQQLVRHSGRLKQQLGRTAAEQQSAVRWPHHTEQLPEQHLHEHGEQLVAQFAELHEAGQQPAVESAERRLSVGRQRAATGHLMMPAAESGKTERTAKTQAVELLH